MAITLKYADMNQDGIDETVYITGAGEGKDGTYMKDQLPSWLYDAKEFVSADGTPMMPPPPPVPKDMPPPPPMPKDNTTFGNNLPKYDTGANGPVTVNTEALQLFSKNLDNLADPLRQLKAEVDKVAVHPGAFYQAFHLKNAVHTDPALQTNTSKVITQTLDAFALIKRAITALIAEYDTVEELNSAGADDLNKHIGAANNLINKMSGS